MASDASMATVPMTLAFATRSVPMTGRTPWERDLGGSESAMVFAARALAARGHHVDVFTRCEEPGVYDDVTYHDVSELDAVAAVRDWDAFISLRFPDLLERDVRATVRMLWCQDVLRGAPLDAWHAWADRFVFVSEWHRRDTVGGSPGIAGSSAVIENSIPIELVPPRRAPPEAPFFVHLSRPERGLEPLLDAWPSILARVPGARLGVARYRSFHEPAGSQVEAFCQRMDERVRATPGASHLGHLSKPELYQLLSGATAMVYPAAFDETSCIAAIESQACGLPIIATARGALPETIGSGAGILVEHGPRWLERFADAVVELAWSAELRESFAAAGKATSRRFASEVVARRWEEEILHCVGQRAALRSAQIARTLVLRGDQDAADGLPLADGPAPSASVAAWVGWGRSLSMLVRAKVGEARPILLTGDESAARVLLAGLPASVSVASPGSASSGAAEVLLDVGGLLCAEDRAGWLEWARSQVRPGGRVVHVLPTTRTFEGQRVCPTYADIASWFGDGPDITCTVEAARPWGVPARCWIVSYAAGDAAGDADQPARKRLWTRPLPTVSACLIVRDAAETLLTTLESIRGVADEIRIVDTGSRDATLDVVEHFRARAGVPVHVRQEEWPGDFSAARNRSTEGAGGDWILWIDADERLIGGERLRRLLQTDHYNAYAIRQHNHIFDGGHTQVEIPFRVYRNDQGYRFFGAVHEHPEQELNVPIDPWIPAPGVDILHYGYLTEATRTRKLLHRNLALLNEDLRRYPGRRLTEILYLRDCVNLARFDLRAGLPIRGDHVQALEVAVARFEEACMPARDRYYHLGREYYDQALGLLGQGAEIHVQVGGPNAERKVHRFRTVADAMRLAADAARLHAIESAGGRR